MLSDKYDLIYNNRKTIKIEVSSEGDGAFAVVDIDDINTHWRHKVTGENFSWNGRVCKIYTQIPNGEWKIILQTGALHYPPRSHQEK
jgi:ketosteroid isomerase-like protein